MGYDANKSLLRRCIVKSIPEGLFRSIRER
jgi:hypothetical protein